MRNILSLDMSTKSTGWCVVRDKSILDYGCFSTSCSNIFTRIYYMRDHILDLIKKYEIEEVVIEEVPPGKNADVYKKLIWLQACIVFALHDYNKDIKVTYMMPSQWRAKIGMKNGRGIMRETNKKDVIDYVYNKFGIKVNDDIADSFGLMDAYINYPDALFFE